ncbi:hypothetical protein ACJX0J_011872, partial [Zea mays]
HSSTYIETYHLSWYHSSTYIETYHLSVLIVWLFNILKKFGDFHNGPCVGLLFAFLYNCETYSLFVLWNIFLNEKMNVNPKTALTFISCRRSLVQRTWSTTVAAAAAAEEE